MCMFRPDKDADINPPEDAKYPPPPPPTGGKPIFTRLTQEPTTRADVERWAYNRTNKRKNKATAKFGTPEYRREVEATMRAAFAGKSTCLDDSLPERLLLAWRLTREMARHMGIAPSGEPLADSMAPTATNLDPWRIPQAAPSIDPYTSSARAIIATGVPAAVVITMDSFKPTSFGAVPESEWESVDPYDPQSARVPGLPLMPPSPDRPRMLDLWKKVAGMMSSHLGLSSGSPNDPYMAAMALPQLLNSPEQAWPSPGEIIAFEDVMIRDCMGALCSMSELKMERRLYAIYGLLSHEIRGLTDMTVLATTRKYTRGTDQTRAVMTMQLQDIQGRARQSLDMRSELNALKQIALIQGLGKTESNDLYSEFTDVVRSIADEPQRQLPP